MKDEQRAFVLLAYASVEQSRTAVALVREHLLFKDGNDGVALGTLDQVLPLLVETQEDADDVEEFAQRWEEPEDAEPGGE